MSGLTVVIGDGSRALYPKISTLRLRCSCFCETSKGGGGEANHEERGGTLGEGVEIFFLNKNWWVC